MARCIPQVMLNSEPLEIRAFISPLWAFEGNPFTREEGTSWQEGEIVDEKQAIAELRKLCDALEQEIWKRKLHRQLGRARSDTISAGTSDAVGRVPACGGPTRKEDR